ncbi:MAG: 50S ribosomal protein L6 [bacterium]|nr:50S ribosomal protein L6 [bacterium]
MSRIGKLPISIPASVTVRIDGRSILVKGPKGELSTTFRPNIEVALEEGLVLVRRANDTPDVRALHGLTRALIANMVRGVLDGWTKELELQGVGYRAALEGSALRLSVGYSHPVLVQPPDGISFHVQENTIRVSGIDRSLVGQIAANIRKVRPPEPYKGKGIRYVGEVVRRKVGKAAATGAAATGGGGKK